MAPPQVRSARLGGQLAEAAEEKVREYINHQAEHHRKKTFQEEYVVMLKRGMVEYREEFLW